MPNATPQNRSAPKISQPTNRAGKSDTGNIIFNGSPRRCACGNAPKRGAPVVSTSRSASTTP
eukprot:10754108-Lingulodinium_polyedra.AAC.1